MHHGDTGRCRHRRRRRLHARHRRLDLHGRDDVPARYARPRQRRGGRSARRTARTVFAAATTGRRLSMAWRATHTATMGTRRTRAATLVACTVGTSARPGVRRARPMRQRSRAGADGREHGVHGPVRPRRRRGRAWQGVRPCRSRQRCGRRARPPRRSRSHSRSRIRSRSHSHRHAHGRLQRLISGQPPRRPPRRPPRPRPHACLTIADHHASDDARPPGRPPHHRPRSTTTHGADGDPAARAAHRTVARGLHSIN